MNMVSQTVSPGRSTNAGYTVPACSTAMACALTWTAGFAHLHDVGPLVHLLAVVLLGQQLDDGLSQLHLLVLLLC